MGKIEILTCNSCGALLSPKVLKCEYCDSVHIVSKNTNSHKISPTLSKHYLQSNEFSNNKLSLALLHLNIKNYDIAKKLLEQEIESNPVDSELYFYCALSLIKGKRIKFLAYSEIKEIYRHLNTSIQIQEDAKYYLLLAIVNYDFFKGNGMILPQPDYLELLDKALEIEKEDLEFLQEQIIIPESELFNQILTN